MNKLESIINKLLGGDILDTIGGLVLLLLVVIFVFKLIKAIRIVPTKSAYIVERLGKYHKTLGAGFHPLIPFIDKVAFIKDLKEETMAVPPQECFTKDNVRVEVDGVIYISVINPVNASYGITDYRFAATQLAQTTTRSVIGTIDLDRTFEERDLISSKVLEVLSEVDESWGIQVHRYEVKNIVPPSSVKNAMEQQMTAERDRRALIAKAEGDRQSRVNRSEGLKAELINRSEGEMQKRVNEAEGRAREIMTISDATAQSIEKLAEAIALGGGDEAVNLRLSQSYISQLGKLAESHVNVLLPADLTRLEDLLASVGLNLGMGEK
ncbi:MAG TPA: paraslipin [Spirochaetes bacterium]|nr:paraslipin [Spirochaetota bacterium]